MNPQRTKWINDIHAIMLKGTDPNAAVAPVGPEAAAQEMGVYAVNQIAGETNPEAFYSELQKASFDTASEINQGISDIDEAFRYTIGTDWAVLVGEAGIRKSFEQALSREAMPGSMSPSMAQSDALMQDLTEGVVSFRNPDSGITDLDNSMLKTLGLTMQEPDVQGMDEDTLNYLVKTTFQGTITGMASLHQLPEYDEEMEKKLSFKAKLTRGVISLGADLPYVLMGGGIPAYGAAAVGAMSKTVPFLANAIPKMGTTGYQIWVGAAGMGFYQGLRQVYTDKLINENGFEKRDWIHRAGSAMLETAKGGAIGGIAGRFNAFRQGKSLGAKLAAGVPEVGVTTVLQAQMERPGYLPTTEDFSIAMAMTLGTEAMFHIRGMKALTKKTPLEVLSRKAADKVMGVRPDAFEEYSIGRDDKWFTDKFTQAYERYGVHPLKLAEDMKNNDAIFEDMTDPTTFNITAYDEASGAGAYDRPGVDIIRVSDSIGASYEASPDIGATTVSLKSIKNDSKMKEVRDIVEAKNPGMMALADAAEDAEKLRGALEAQRLGGEADKGTAAGRMQRDETSGNLADEQSGGTLADFNRKSVHEALGSDYINPLNLRMGEPFFVVDAGEGRKLVVSKDYTRNLAASNKLLLHVPDMVQLLVKLTGRFPSFVKGLEGSFGHMLMPEGVRDMRLKTISNKIKATRQNITRNKNRGVEVKNMEAYLAQLQEARSGLSRPNPEPFGKSEIIIEIDKTQASTKTLPDGSVVQKTPQERSAAILRTLTHEIGHVIDYMSSEWELGKTKIMDPLTAKLHNFGTETNGFLRQIENTHGERSGELLLKEAAALSMLWRPAQSHETFNRSDYRLSSAELAADFNSAIIGNSAIVKEVAPNLYRAWESYLNDRPSAAKAVNELINHLENGQSLQDAGAMLAGEEFGFRSAEKIKAAHEEAIKASSSAGNRRSWDALMNQVFDSAYGALKFINGNTAARNTIERYQAAGTVTHKYVSRVLNEFVKPMREELGLSNEDIGLLLFYNRNMSGEDRQGLINSYGFDPKTSSLEFDRMYQDVMAKTGKDVNRILDRFYKIRQEEIVKLAKDSGRFSDRMLETMQNNEAYARYQLVKFYEKELKGQQAQTYTGMSSRQLLTSAEAARQKQTGSVEAIVNPLAATLENDILMINTILRENAMEQVIVAMQESGSPAVAESEWTLFEKRSPLDPQYSEMEFNLLEKLGVDKADMVPISFTRRVEKTDAATGDKYMGADSFTYRVPRSVADVFSMSPRFIRAYHEILKSNIELSQGAGVAALTAAAKGLDLGSSIFRFFAITANVAFQMKNVAYDAGRSYINAPMVKGKYVQSLIPGSVMMRHYGAAIKSQYRAAFGDGGYSDMFSEMLDHGIVMAGARYSEGVDGTDLSDTYIARHTDELSRSNHINGKLGYVGYAAKKAPQFLSNILQFSEGIQNEASYRFLKANQKDLIIKDAEGKKTVGASDDEVDVIARSWMGSPAYMRRGKASSLINRLVPFSNTMMQATRGDLESISNNKSAWIAKMMISTIAPAVATALMGKGIFDNEETVESQGGTWSEILETKTKYEKTAFITMPVWYNRATGKGLTMGTPLPQGIQERTLFAFTYEMTGKIVDMARSGNIEAKDALEVFLAIGSDALTDASMSIPGRSPVLRTMAATGAILRGKNVGSPYAAGGDYFSREKMARMNASDMGLRMFEKAKAIASYVPDAFAVPVIGKLMRDNEDILALGEAVTGLMNPPDDADLPYYAKQASTLLGYPLGYAFSGYAKYGNSGIREHLYLLGKKDEARAATIRIQAESALKGRQLDGDISVPKSLKTSVEVDKFVSAMQRTSEREKIKLIADPNIRFMMSKRSPSQKEYLINRINRDKSVEVNP